MRIGIDASSISDGGGITHLSQILNNFNFKNNTCKKIIIWGNKNTLKNIRNIKNLEKIYLDKKFSNVLLRIYWQMFLFEKELKNFNCNKAFILGGISFLKKIPSTIIMQNVLPFENLILNKYSFMFRVKCKIQKKLFNYSIKRANKIIFLSKTSKKQIIKQLSKKKINYKIIPHGVVKDNFSKRNFKFKKKIKLICISKIDFYKNQLVLLKALRILLDEGYNLELKLVGSNFKPSLEVIKRYISNYKLDKFISIKGKVNFKNIYKEYKNSNIHIAPSFCESFGITVIESGNFSIPLICSDIKIFREITNNNVFLFNPNDEFDLVKKIKKTIHNNFQRQKNIKGYYNFINKNYSWKQVSKKTFDYVLK